MDNVAREFLATLDRSIIDEHREYGDAALIRDIILAALLGDDQEIVVLGADDYDDTDETPEAKAKYGLQEWLRTTFANDRGRLKVIETERNAVGLGDGVYTLGWSAELQRVRIRCWDPGFYFPVLEDGNEDDFPETVHIAWEFQELGNVRDTFVRRLTWQLAPIQPADAGGILRKPIVQEGDIIEPNGLITRQHPWNEQPSAKTCYFSDGTWRLDIGGNYSQRVESLADADGTFVVQNLDLKIDFLPVVHMPNTVAILNHYGRGSLDTVMQVLDDLANADTDLQKASATAARPFIALEGGTLGTQSPAYRPGEVWETGEGKVHVVDTSNALKAILDYVEFLMKRLTVNSRIPDAVLGRLGAQRVSSGIALALSFGPLSNMVGEMRLVRGEKYPLLLKFLWRMSVAGGVVDVPPEWFPADMKMGNYLPQDKTAAVDLVQKLLSSKPKGASLETCVAIMQQAGYPIDDAVEEVHRIESRDFDGAAVLFTAAGSEQLVLDYLHIDTPPDDIRQPAPIQPVMPPNPDVPPAVPLVPLGG